MTMTPSSVQVEDILKSPVFAGAKIVAGRAGLVQPVRWVHILEVSQVNGMLRGGEFVLTTGIGFGNREEGFLSYVKQLIEGGAVGLCIELGTFVTEIPHSVVKLANLHNFPLVVFSFQVHFVDITQEIHTLLLGQNSVQSKQASPFLLNRAEEQYWVTTLTLLKGQERSQDGQEPSLPEVFLQQAVYRVLIIDLSYHLSPSGQESRDTIAMENLVQVVQLHCDKQDIHSFAAIRHKRVILLMQSTSTKGNSLKNSISIVVRQTMHSLQTQGWMLNSLAIGIGSEVQDPSRIFESYEDAIVALIAAQQSPATSPLFIEDAGIYRWLVPRLRCNSERMTHPDVQQLVTYDKNHGGQLVETLKTYLDLDRNKQRTADKLFIHRQTLYHRLQQIQDIFQMNLDDPAQRLALHLSVYLHLLQQEFDSAQSDSRRKTSLTAEQS